MPFLGLNRPSWPCVRRFQPPLWKNYVTGFYGDVKYILIRSMILLYMVGAGTFHFIPLKPIFQMQLIIIFRQNRKNVDCRQKFMHRNA